jgi:hypothetical protein
VNWNGMTRMLGCGMTGASIVLFCMVLSCQAQSEQTKAGAPVAVAMKGSDVSPELTDTNYLFEVVRHVYRWYIDENDVDRLVGATEFPFWVRMLDTPLDAGDHSRIAEIVMPLLGTRVTVKKPDYRIDEMNITVTGGTYRITNVSKIDIPKEPLTSHRVVNVSYSAMREYLFRTRSEAGFPEGALLERLRRAVRKEVGLRPEERTAGRQIAHLAPLSPVANEVWVYLEMQKLLVRFASDIDLVNPAMWAHETLMVKTWDVRTQVVVSLDEAAGSNAFMTRDQIGRALYNCIVLGRRLEVTNPEVNPGKGAEAGSAPGKASERARQP